MNFRQMIGLALLSIGVVLIVMAFQGMGYLKSEKRVQITNSPMSPTELRPVDGSGGHSLLIGALAMLVVGVAISVYYREK